uniref:Alanine dehydrogenase/pyridine nucleotide transhydrogenase NAD(H)-binding domain-containing protein n=1 Tax=Leucosporidium scottii TaxID=5278 RepID=A0A0H5FU00_9BASI|nr:hypothetical protein ls5931a1_00038 [Leucosporidium scottii]
MLESKSRFIDWELLGDTSSSGQFQRTTAFGWYAGFAAAADGLQGLGTKLLASCGVSSPLLSLQRPHQATGGVEEIVKKLKEVGEQWRAEGGRQGLGGPLTLVISGRGRVGKGAESAFDHLGVEWVTMEELRRITADENADVSKIYAVQLELKDWLKNKEGKAFDREEYRQHPERFESSFAKDIAPHTTLFLNGGFWEPGCPRILTTAELASVQQEAPEGRFLSVVDVGCDWGGALEFVVKPTTVDDPVVQFDASTGEITRDPATPHTTQVSSVEIYPSTLPLDASNHFSEAILPYVRSLLADPTCSGKDKIAVSLRNAIVCEDGELVERHQKLYELLKEREAGRGAKRVVLLGSGLVAGPAVKTLAARENVDIIIASNDLKSAEKLAQPYRNVTATPLDASNSRAVESLVADADVVLSLLPAPLHVGVAKLCIKNGTSLVTASYVSPEMNGLHAEAKEADIVLLNELGLDPGIDHASAMKLIEEARESGNEITSFVSFCGGLPSPELSGGPLGYKFSWSPRGVLTAALNDARFRLNSREVLIPGAKLLSQNFAEVPIVAGFAFEGVANRNSLGYLKEYGLPEDLPTILRGTLRYPGFARTVNVFKQLGLLSLEPLDSAPARWEETTDLCLRRAGHSVTNRDSRLQAISELSGSSDVKLAEDVLSTLEELHLAPSSSTATVEASLPAVPTSPQAPIDLLSTLLGAQLAYTGTERDAVILHHELTTTSPTKETELFTSTLVQYGNPDESAMATTVGVPIALGALLILDGAISNRGIVSPSSPEVWKPLLDSLDGAGVKLVEKRVVGRGRGVLEVLEKQLGEAAKL